jgi:molybdate transport system ATP-binding protein
VEGHAFQDQDGPGHGNDRADDIADDMSLEATDPQMKALGPPPAHASQRPATWDVHLRRILQHGASRFALDVAFTSHAPRVVLYGPSGAGKTQTLRLVAGIGRPDAGHVRVADRTLVDRAAGLCLSPQQRRMGCVFQDYALFPHLNVRQNIAFALHSGWRNPPRTAGTDPRCEHWLEQLALQPVAGLYPHQLSGGQRQRTALARALVHGPAALLLDEPFAALDKPLRQRLREELLALQQQLQLPMLLITHDDDDVRWLAQQVVTIEQGRVTGVSATLGDGT